MVWKWVRSTIVHNLCNLALVINRAFHLLLGLVVTVISFLRLVTFLHGRSPTDTVAEFKEHGVHLGSMV